VAKIKTIIIDEQPFFRAGVRQALVKQGNLDILEFNPDDATLFDVIEVQSPDVVLLGSDLANQSSLELGKKIARNFPNTKVIILSPDPNDEELFEVIRSSAVACLKKNASAEELVETINKASHGEYPINDTVITRPFVAQQVLEQFQHLSSMGKHPENVVAVLTKRETQVLNHIANGNTNRQIANTLSISEQTIKNHVSAILRKLNANDRAHAVVLAIRNGWISIS
jgi:DNA-binding NarL/FixJ family response regulator